MKTLFATTAVLVFLLDSPVVFQGQTRTDGEVEAIVAQSEEALDHANEKAALSLVRDALRRFPADEELRVQLAAVYAYQHRDSEAIAILEQVIKGNPASRQAWLKLAQIRGYRGEYGESDRRYRELLASNPDDEAAALGLAHNLVLEGKREEARQQVQQALQRHPTSLLLQQYNDALGRSATVDSEVRAEKRGRIQTSETFFADSSGNRAVESFQSVFYQFTRDLTSSVRLDETSLWRTTTPAVSAVSADDEVRFLVGKFVAVRASGGAIRYPDTSSKWIASGDLDLFPVKNLVLSGGYSRYPAIPTFDSTLFDLSAEGWHSRLHYGTKNFTLSGAFYLRHYSDGNRGEREWGEMLRWVRLSDTVSFGAGYAVRHMRFAQELNHGYFSPSQYWSQLGTAGLRARISRHYRAELLLYGGAETLDAGPYTPAGQVLLRNEFNFGRWDFAGDYSYYHLAQATGAFHANAGSLNLAYKF